MKKKAPYLVVGFSDDQVSGLVVDDKLPGGVVEGEGDLVEDGAQLLQSQDPQGVGGDGDDPLGALLRREAGGVLEALVRQGRQVEPVLRQIIYSKHFYTNHTKRTF